MEVCVPSNAPTCQYISSCSGSSTDPSSTDYTSGDFSMNGLKTCLTEILSTEDIEISTIGIKLSPGENSKGNVVSEDECEDLDKTKFCNSASEKCSSNCGAFPALGVPKPSVDGLLSGEKGQGDDRTSEASEENGFSKSVDTCDSQSTLRPIPLKLVPALKGSREKLGIAPKKRSITWAPDVYDPTPTSVSHVPSSKNQRYRNGGKKYRKNKQNGGGKSSRGSRGKDKKQARKDSGGTTKLKPLHDDSVVGGISEPQVDIVDLNILSPPDPFCGSSFLKKSVTNLHFPVAEAT